MKATESILSFMPPAKDNRWFRWYLIYALVITALLSVYRFAVLGAEFDVALLGRFALLALAFSGIVHICGWFGGKWVWLITTAGLIVGFYTMFRYSGRDMSGWEDLASFVAFMMFAAGSFVLGLIIEGIRWLINRSRGV
ncbi:hypothetical protein [Paenibacillus tengchongensis]|uniref:hypothetical protein n=1 Tax=Paenibacillus tengchongensis TaxID=2608684 RepID=UPI00124BDCF2|nr:hypothetical protein [Paenibacillus tengchongensis]